MQITVWVQHNIVPYLHHTLCVPKSPDGHIVYNNIIVNGQTVRTDFPISKLFIFIAIIIYNTYIMIYSYYMRRTFRHVRISYNILYILYILFYFILFYTIYRYLSYFILFYWYIFNNEPSCPQCA